MHLRPLSGQQTQQERNKKSKSKSHTRTVDSQLRQQLDVNQFKNGVLMRRSFFIGVRVNDSDPVHHVYVGKESRACQIRHKKYRQEITHDMQ